MSKILKHSPFASTRASQKEVLKAIEKAFSEGYKNVLLEMPVGGGKSLIAITAAKYFGQAHILTPRKSLQNQYSEDFSSHGVALMKGRSSYPCLEDCTAEENQEIYKHISNLILNRKVIPVASLAQNCSTAPCIGNREYLNKCTGVTEIGKGEVSDPTHPCPYHIAIDVAQNSSIIVHNLHSFIFQSYFAGRFQERNLLVIDECHEVEGIVRGFAAKKIILPVAVKPEKLEETKLFKTLDEWVTWLEDFQNLFKDTDNFGCHVSNRAEYLQLLLQIKDLSDTFSDKFVSEVEVDALSKKTKFSFIPEQVGNLINNFLLSYGKKRLLMSGTIYNKSLYCKNNGLKEEETCFIRIGSSFPKVNRPIYFKDEYKVDTSHRLWDQNFTSMITKIKSIMEVFDDVKGLIHTPSYLASIAIHNALKSTGRVVAHTKDDFQQVLTDFYSSEDPKVLLSPVCQQGVDFKYDRARFQIVLRVPYANTSDTFVDHKVKKDFPWYNYQALVTFGQQIGRVNRSEDDFGVTILMDERFGKFISRNKNVLPKWLTEAIIYK